MVLRRTLHITSISEGKSIHCSCKYGKIVKAVWDNRQEAYKVTCQCSQVIWVTPTGSYLVLEEASDEQPA